MTVITKSYAHLHPLLLVAITFEWAENHLAPFENIWRTAYPVPLVPTPLVDRASIMIPLIPQKEVAIVC